MLIILIAFLLAFKLFSKADKTIRQFKTGYVQNHTLAQKKVEDRFKKNNVIKIASGLRN